MLKRQRHGLAASKTGYGVTRSHLGEVFQGQLEDCSGRRTRCLVSLPCEAFHALAKFVPDSSGAVEVVPARKVRACRAAVLFLEVFRLSGGGRLTIQSNILEGKGLGSSTSDCIAAIRSVADAFGIVLSDPLLACLVVRAETASDNTMFDHAVLFAQREGIILEDYGRPFPRIDVIGVDTDAARAIDTLTYKPAEYSWRLLQKFETLRGALRRGLRTNDITLLGQVATASAAINQEFLPKACFNELLQIARHSRSLGIVVAHSGTVAGILLDPRAASLEHQAAFVMEKLCDLGLPVLARFQTSQLICESSHDYKNEDGSHSRELPSYFDTAQLEPGGHHFPHHENFSG
jgi:uncharacterized protein involved in propanediol utilization